MRRTQECARTGQTRRQNAALCAAAFVAHGGRSGDKTPLHPCGHWWNLRSRGNLASPKITHPLHSATQSPPWKTPKSHFTQACKGEARFSPPHTWGSEGKGGWQSAKHKGLWEGQRPRCPIRRHTGNEDVAPPVRLNLARSSLPMVWLNPVQSSLGGVSPPLNQAELRDGR